MGQFCSKATTLLLPGHTLVWKNGTEKAEKTQSEVQWAARCSPAHPKYCTHLYAQHTKIIRNAATLQNTMRIPYGITQFTMPIISFFFFKIKLNKAAWRVKRLEIKKRTGRKGEIFHIKQYPKGQRQLKGSTWTWFNSHCDSLFDIICVSFCAQIPTITRQAVHGLQEPVLFHMHTPHHHAHTALQSDFQDTCSYCPPKRAGGCLRFTGLQTSKRCYPHSLTCSQHPHKQIPPLKFSRLIKGLSQFLM